MKKIVSRLITAVVMTVSLITTSVAQTFPADSISNGPVPYTTPGQWQNYSYTFTATTTGANYIGFAFRQVPAFWTFTNVGVYTTSPTNNLVYNGNMASGGNVPNTYVQAPTGWGIWYQGATIPGAAGSWQPGGNPGGTGGVWYDGAVQTYDGIYQAFNATAGTTYTVSFQLEGDNSTSVGSGIAVGVYAGSCGSGTTVFNCSPGSGFNARFTPDQTAGAITDGIPPPPGNPTDPGSSPAPTPGPTLVAVISGPTPVAASTIDTAQATTVTAGTIQSDAATQTLPQNISISGISVVDQNGNQITLSGTISGSGSLTIANSANGGQVIITGQNTYTGATTVNQGATLNNQGSIATSSGVTNAGTFINSGTAPSVNNAGTFTNSGTAGDLTNSGTATNSGTLGDVTNSNIFSNLLNGIINSLTNSGTASNDGTITTTVNNTGTFDNTGTTGAVTNSGTATNSGTVGNVTNTEGTFTNSGVAGNIDNAGTVNNSGTAGNVINAVTGFFNNLVNGVISSLTNSGTASNAGTITNTVNNTGVFTNTGTTGDVTNTGGTVTNSGTVGSIINNAGTVTNYGQAGRVFNSDIFNNIGTTGDVTNAGSFNNQGTAGSVINTNLFSNLGTTGDVTNSGTFDNSGTTGAVTNSGRFTVGAGGSVGSINNSGTFNISGTGTPVRLGSYTQSASGVTVMSVAPGTIQQMTVAGTANLNGAIAFNAAAGPYQYGVYNFLTAQRVNGQYSLLGLLPNDTISPLGFGLVYTDTTAGLKITPSAAYTLASIDRNVSAISGINNLQMATLDGSLNYDCTLYGEKNMCVSTGIRYVKDASGDLSGGNITLGYKINSKFRVGLFTDKGFNNLTIGNVTQKAGTPILGGYANWSEDPRGYGWGVRASAATTSAKMDVTRQASAWSEAGTGTSNVSGQAFQLKGTYTLPIGTRLTLAPYAGLRYTTLSNGGFTETGAQYPLTYNSLTQTTTDAMTGIGAGYNFGRATAFVSAGVIRNLSYSAGAVSGSSNIINLSSYNIALPGSNYTSLGFGAGFTYDVAKNQYLTTSFGWQQKSLVNTNVSNFGINYMVGF
jgi:hypothetical protein